MESRDGHEENAMDQISGLLKTGKTCIDERSSTALAKPGLLQAFAGESPAPQVSCAGIQALFRCIAILLPS